MYSKRYFTNNFIFSDNLTDLSCHEDNESNVELNIENESLSPPDRNANNIGNDAAFFSSNDYVSLDEEHNSDTPDDQLLSENINLLSSSSSENEGSCSENSNSEVDDAGSESVKNSSSIYNDNRIMFADSGSTVQEVKTALQALSVRHNLSDTAVEEIGNLLKIMAPSNFHYKSLLNKYHIFKQMEIPAGVIKYYFYCKKCKENILYCCETTSFKMFKKTCSNCNTEQLISFRNINYFTYIDIKYQLKKIIECDRLRKSMLEHHERKLSNLKAKKSFINDATDGILHEKLTLDESCCTLTANMNVDGAPLFETSSMSMFPVQLRLNQLSPKDSISTVILCGFLLVREEPSAKFLNLYLKVVLVENIKKLSTVGIRFKSENKDILFKLFLSLCPVDSKARPVIQNR